METTDGIIALELLGHFRNAHPEHAALFLLAVLYPDMQSLSIAHIKWRNINFEQGKMHLGTETFILPEAVLELIELARERRPDEPDSEQVFRKNQFPEQMWCEYFTNARTLFNQYKLRESARTFQRDDAPLHVDTPAHIVRHWVTRMQDADKHKGYRRW